MSWLFSRALVEEYLEDTFSDGEPSAQLNGNPTQQAYCAPDKMTAFSRLSRFGMMFKPLTEDRGEELLMSYLEGFHVKTSPQPEKGQELTESDQECGEKWQGSFAKYDQNSSSWKTHQCLLLGGLDEFSETWPRWGLMQNGECWEQQTLELRTNETESGLLEKWPTPLASDWKPRGPNSIQKGLQEIVKKRMWPTPRTPSGGPDNSAHKLRPSGHRGTTNLEGAVKMWTTPVSDDTGHRKNKYAQGGTALSTQAGGKLNPTWVEWLMGWPLEWTDLKPLETDKFQKWLDAHGKS